jgi:hypothetical protein
MPSSISPAVPWKGWAASHAVATAGAFGPFNVRNRCFGYPDP